VLGGVAVSLAAALDPEVRDTFQNSVSSNFNRLESIARWLVAKEIWILLLLGPLFLLPRRSFSVVFLAIPILWILRWRVRGRLTRRTPFDWSILGLLVMLGVSFLVSADLDRSLPKLAGVLWGVAVFYAIVNRAPSPREMAWIALGIVGAGGLVALVGLAGTQWITGGKFLPDRIYSLLPRVLLNIPGTAQGWIHPNEVGGSLALIVPFAFVVVASYWNDKTKSESLPRIWNWWLLAAALVLTTGVLVLSQSRSALFGVVISVALYFAIRWRRARWVIAAVAVGALIVFAVLGYDRLGDLLAGSSSESTAVGTLDFAGRQEVWERALYAIQDFPFTGVGLNMFDPVSKVLYPYFLVSPDAVLTHAHDIYLQVTVDLGIPGLVAYIALLSAMAYMVIDVWLHSPSALFRTLALAAGLGVFAHQVFGFTDALGLGVKPGIILWAMLGLVGLIWASANNQIPGFPEGKKPGI